MSLEAAGQHLKLRADPTIAVVMPILNERAALPAAVEMLLQLPVDETIVVDGGSNDGSRELLGSYPLILLDSTAGRASQMNAGAAICKSDIVLFIHVDTVLNSSHITALKSHMKHSKDVGGRFDVRLSGKNPLFRIIEWAMNIRSRLTRISTGDQCIFVRRTIFEQIGGFPDQPLMEDIGFSRCLKKSGKIICLKERVTTSSRRWEQKGILRTIVLMWKLRLLYWLGVAPDQLAKLYR